MCPLQAPIKGDGYGMADIHIHSSVSDGMADIPSILESVEARANIDIIAITDHDRIEGSYQARELAARHGYHLDVVVGMEVTTAEGHLLALFLEDPVPSHRPLEETIEAIHAQGGLCIVPHPMSWLTHSINEQSLERIIASNNQGLYFDGIETVNPTIAGRVSSRRARRFKEKYRLAETGGSDAHFLIAVGSAFTLFPGRSAEDLRRSIIERTTKARNGIRVRLSEIGFVQIIKQQRKSGGFSIPRTLKNFIEGLRE
jgi:hypothetical protein